MKLSFIEKQRLHRVVSKTLLLLGVGLGYAAFVTITGWGIPCVFRLVTGLRCPGCGISRMFLALLRFDIEAAAGHNLLVLCLLPFAVVMFFYKSWQYVKMGETEMSTAEKVIFSVVFVLCIAFFVFRNTNIFSF